MFWPRAHVPSRWPVSLAAVLLVLAFTPTGADAATALSASLGPVARPAPALAQQASGHCTFVLGFKTLHDRIPQLVGECLVDEHHNPVVGDTLQETMTPKGTQGLLVWRKQDNWTAFTNGSWTWVNGPSGLQDRPNDRRFRWEANPEGLPWMDGAPSAPPPGGFLPEVTRGDPSTPLVALTFDAGSVVGETARTLDILKQHGVRSSFFITGQFAERNPALIRRMAAEGHEVWNHSYTHPDFTTIPDSEIIAEMEKAETVLSNLTGMTTKPLMRMPFGARNQRVWQAVGRAGYRSIYWTLDAGDWRDGWTAEMVRNQVLNNVGNGYIVVQHTNPTATADALDEIIRTLKSRGYQLVPVSVMIK